MYPSSRAGRTAFTLIELLIVIAIIAILALIAIPNFLEAQVRSKVSRAKSDMRILAGAIEAYTIDYNRAPIGNVEARTDYDAFGIPNGPLLFHFLRMATWSRLTTPVAYLTTVPYDPFGEKLPISTATSAGYNYFTVYNLTNAKMSTCWAYGYRWGIPSAGPSLAIQGGNNQLIPSVLSGTNTDGGPGGYIYDPSNGTNSWGLIARTNKGAYERPLQ